VLDDDARGGLTVLWFKVESKMASHRKTRLIPRDRAEVPLRTAAMGAWWFAACWAAENESDGFIPAEETERFDPDGVLIPWLVKAEYFEPATVGGERGWILHDWLDVQESKADLEAARERDAAQKRRARAAKASRPSPPDSPPDDDGPGGGHPADVPTGVPADVPGGLPDGRLNGHPADVPGGLATGLPDELPLGLPGGVDSREKRREEQLTTLDDSIVRGRAARPHPDDPPGFREWYSSYPRHVAVARARAAYRAARKKTDESTLLAGARRFAMQMRAEQRPEDKIAHPASWLNDERWLDEVRRRDTGLMDHG